MNPLLDAALRYAGRGWPVFPVWEVVANGEGGWRCACSEGDACGRPGKHPRVRDGLNEATTNPTTIQNWWTRWPDASIGVATGRASNLLVVDADAADGKPGVVNLTALSAKHGGLPATATVNTGGGGIHIYLRYDERLKTGANVIAEAIDVRSDGGYAILPPSQHKSGRRYEWRNPEIADLITLPDWLLEKPKRKSEAPKAKRKSSKLSLEQVEAMLGHVDHNDRDAWLNAGIILGREFGCSPDAWHAYETWASRSPKFDEDRAGNLARMKEAFYERSQEEPRAGGKPLSIGTLIDLAKKGGWEPEVDLSDSDHYRLAEAVIAAIERATGERPVYTLGAIYCYNEGIWRARKLDAVAMDVARIFAGGKYCKRRSDFSSVAAVAASLCEDEKFFESAAVGIAAPGGFWFVTDEGEIRCEPLTADHRQRMRVKADPDPKAQPVRLLKMLREAFAGRDPERQIHLMQQLAGLAITRALWRHMIAVLLLGASKSGKSTFLALLSSVFPRDLVGATSPQRWDDEYYCAALAGMALNIVGELDPKKPIPGGEFKNTVGRDIRQGRHPTHRPFTFVCEAAHFFNANQTPPVTDHSDAFFNRWRIVHFANTVPAEHRVRDLDKLLIAEETGAFLWWALEGAADVARAGQIAATDVHKELLLEWRVGNNSALKFITDREECERSADAFSTGQALYERYRVWSQANGVKVFGRSGFYDAIVAGGGEAGVRIEERNNQVHVVGVKLKDRPTTPVTHVPATAIAQGGF